MHRFVFYCTNSETFTDYILVLALIERLIVHHIRRTTFPLKLPTTLPQAVHYFLFIIYHFATIYDICKSIRNDYICTHTHTYTHTLKPNHWKTIRFLFMCSTLICIFQHQQFECISP